MNNIYVIISVAYFIYYAGNIIYDGFLTKEKVSGKDEVQEYSLGIVDENQNTPSKVQIDDVENLNMPQSFQKREVYVENTVDREPDLERWRESFEAEQELEYFERDQNTNPNPKQEENDGSSSTSANSLQKKKKIDIKKMLNEAETKIQLVANRDGFKTYNLV